MHKRNSPRQQGPASDAEGLSALLYQLSHLISQGMLRPEFVRDLGDELHAEIDMLLKSPRAKHQDVAGLSDARARFDETLLCARSKLLLDAVNRTEAPLNPSCE
ncbi:hypothetical protein D3C87_1163160 [compost metagenome]|jgi:hypothetical protein|uniref:Uncharacterized protein n=1 Tax=Cupriavidus campinensis TaxID=151783 RepID=A0AAE9L3Q6_9BURK|nr:MULTISPECIES: hypothetical protein [Cupriavidus]TSP12201.1 hypothetical protein FGG12_14425 [Cupriavidus campinensis]URF06148.1 hypothetical protein M5D45_23745 [Cupriavidus campinensis]CAG2129179.1 hypothetical protein LMG19282_00137 [Cupriavidus campinensis]